MFPRKEDPSPKHAISATFHPPCSPPFTTVLPRHLLTDKRKSFKRSQNTASYPFIASAVRRAGHPSYLPTCRTVKPWEREGVLRGSRPPWSRLEVRYKKGLMYDGRTQNNREGIPLTPTIQSEASVILPFEPARERRDQGKKHACRKDESAQGRPAPFSLALASTQKCRKDTRRWSMTRLLHAISIPTVEEM
ncbi:hypothetical protein BU26DRAFT_329420 [Trematosphaeria pertusa]|uniref:Uncharacterized protein n=1 Tax=Trematosphaeria pertusa TaxID=390896 RepID=A0A6A6IFB6_9PLEO|nr:uncharacterized protein BU26DRAFT_329420 [Trematosphaeria pertusa]KAF2248220.1 hypothetical protein BU26DRAFT_329420 [Trematosphaeria pertusa]